MPALTTETETTGTWRDRLAAPDDANVVIVYSSEEHGSLDTCGCAVRPRGSLARVRGYADRVEPGDAVLLLDVGGWLDDATYPDGSLQEHVPIRDGYLLDALEAGRWDVLGVGWRDVPYLAAAKPAAPVVSANVPGLPTHRVFVRSGIRVAVTSVTGPGLAWKQVAETVPTDPIAALRALVPTLDADLVVVLAFDTDDATRAIVRDLPGVDVVIEADAFTERFEALGDADTVWVRAYAEGMRAGELRLTVADGAVVSAVDRQIDLDDAIPHDRVLWRLRTEQARALGASKR